MSLSDLAALGSFISGVAVVFSFVFLAFQIRQSNQNQRSLMQQGRSSRILGAISQLVDPYASGLVVRAGAMDLDFTSSEANSVMRIIGVWFWNYEDTFLQFQAGTLDSSGWESDLEGLKFMLADPACRVSWQMMRGYMGGDFRDYVDNLMRETKVVPLPDYAKRWRELMIVERAAAQ